MIDLTKKYTLNGNEVIQIAYFPEARENERLVAIIRTKAHGNVLATFNEDGVSPSSADDLVQVKEEVSRWLVEWENGFYRNILGDYNPCFFSDRAANEFAKKYGGTVHEVKIKIKI